MKPILFNTEMDRINIEHDTGIVSFAHLEPRDDRLDLYTYYFTFENSKINLLKIDILKKTGRTGKTYKHEEIYHRDYKDGIYNYETNEWEVPVIPESIRKNAENLYTGFVVNNMNIEVE